MILGTMADQDPSERRRLATLAVHAGTAGAQPSGSLALPLFRTSAYTFASTAELLAHKSGASVRMDYGRYGNPTQAAAEAKVAALTGAEDALLCASGMAALSTTLLATLGAGQHLVVTGDCYRRTRQLCRELLAGFGVLHTVVPAGDPAAILAAVRPETRLVLTESPTNPYLTVVDVPALAAGLRAHPGCALVIDATFATPVNQRSLELGADLEIHSATKYLAGHNDVLVGVIAGRAPLVSTLREALGVLGGIVDPGAAWLLVRGLKTLVPRVRQQNATAARLAQVLAAHPEVERVFYPGLPTHPTHEVALRTMPGGYGGVLSFLLARDLEGTSRFVDAVRIPHIGPSLGGVESLIGQVALMSYYELTPDQRQAIGIRDSLVRLAVGLEDPDDLEADLLRALDTTC